MMNEHGKSDRPIVPEKSANPSGRPCGEEMEGRGLVEGKPAPAKHVPDSEPGLRAKRAGAGTCSNTGHVLT
jgi:hypothetical protein